MQQSDDSPFEFPCSFPIKVMGRAETDFDVWVVGIVRKHVRDLHEAAVSSRVSSEGNYCSVTVTIEAESRAQLDAIYQELSSHQRVLMVL